MDTNKSNHHCGKCQSENVTILPNPNANVAPDMLDLRGIVAPIEPLAICNDCGHVAPRDLISTPAPETLGEMPWNDVLSLPMPDMARHYLKAAQMYDMSEDVSPVGLASLQAAWCCEDAGCTEAALRLRDHAGILLLSAEFDNQALTHMFTLTGCECARLTGAHEPTPKFIFDRLGCSAIDLWRTACLHKNVTPENIQENLSMYFLYHIYLCQTGDCSPHRLSDIPHDILIRFAELNGFNAKEEYAKIK